MSWGRGEIIVVKSQMLQPSKSGGDKVDSIILILAPPLYPLKTFVIAVDFIVYYLVPGITELTLDGNP